MSKWFSGVCAALACFVCTAGEPRKAEVIELSDPPAAVLDLDSLPARNAAEVISPPENAVRNDRLRAAITADGSTFPGSWLLLDGSSSSAPGGFVERYEWKQLRGPSIEILSPSAPQVWLFLAQSGEYRFALRAGSESK